MCFVSWCRLFLLSALLQGLSTSRSIAACAPFSVRLVPVLHESPSLQAVVFWTDPHDVKLVRSLVISKDHSALHNACSLGHSVNNERRGRNFCAASCFLKPCRYTVAVELEALVVVTSEATDFDLVSTSFFHSLATGTRPCKGWSWCNADDHFFSLKRRSFDDNHECS